MGLYGLAFALFLASLLGAGSVGFVKGASSRNGEIANLKAAIAIHERIALDANSKAEKAAGAIRIVYRDRTREIVKEAEAQVKLVEVIRREIDPNCSLPPAFRVLWDGSAAPGSAAVEDPPGTSVPLGDLAETAAEARKRFEGNKAKLDSLQRLLKELENG